ncbi:hypothetical protein KPH14_012202 [Odynerus spinipes]|uniref:Transposase n=1 Tax=Odynerus spinipes TaxID=1348599 RepID=A0AAD9RFJ2_9HYME|nr:hypothetical protein KPH14_012202 [Odynerus spinipes]
MPKKNKYSHNRTAADNTWLERCHVSVETSMLITYCFSVHMSFEQTIREPSIISGEMLSKETVSDRFSFCSEVCMVAVDNSFEEDGQLGGDGEIVEIDECKIGRRKYHQERLVKSTWILGMIRRGHSVNYWLEICPENKREINV